MWPWAAHHWIVCYQLYWLQFRSQSQRYQCKYDSAVFTIDSEKLTWTRFSQSTVHIDNDIPYFLHPTWFILPFWAQTYIKSKKHWRPTSPQHNASHDDYVRSPKRLCHLLSYFTIHHSKRWKCQINDITAPYRFFFSQPGLLIWSKKHEINT